MINKAEGPPADVYEGSRTHSHWNKTFAHLQCMETSQTLFLTMAPAKFIVRFFAWLFNRLVAPGGDGKLLDELDLKMEVRQSQNQKVALTLVLIYTVLNCLVSWLCRDGRVTR